MKLFVLGINHRSAPVEIREQVHFEPGRMAESLGQLSGVEGLEECLIVSTCNRTELYCVGDAGVTARVREWLVADRSLASAARDCIYTLEDSPAIQHVFNVACGLDSMILGESQILGQLKDAWRAAHARGSLGPVLNRLFQRAFSVAKQVRTDTGIGMSAISVAFAAVSLARQIFSGFEQHCALLIGAGETIELAARHLHGQGLGRMIIANRSVDRARDLAALFDAYAISLPEIPAHIAEADIVIASTASPLPVVGRDMLRVAMRKRRQRPVFLVDLAVPRDIDPAVATLENVYLYSIDDLREVIEQNLRMRQEAAESAAEIVAAAVARFERNLRLLGAVPVIRAVRQQGEEISAETLEQARRMLVAGRAPAEVIEFLAATITKRFLHAPSARLRTAGEDGDLEMLRAARSLFGLHDDEET